MHHDEEGPPRQQPQNLSKTEEASTNPEIPLASLGGPSVKQEQHVTEAKEESVQPVTSNRSLPEEDQIPAVPKSLPSQLEETLENCPKFRIVVVGKSGIGKSSLIKNVFNVDPDKIHISHSDAGRADINFEYEYHENSRFILHDSQGFEAGSKGQWKKVEEFLEYRQKLNLPRRIHAIWFCVETPLDGSRLLHVGDESLLKLAKDFDIPIITVFTKYDLLVTQFWRKDEQAKTKSKRDADAERNALEKFNSSVKQLQEEWAKLSPKCASIPCVRISTTDSNATEMLKVLEDKTQKTIHEAGNQLQVLWVAAQQVNARKKVELSISEGFKKYWLNLGQSSGSEGRPRQSSPFEGQILIDCVHRIHEDVVKVWNFNDPTKILSGTRFFTEMMGLVKPFIDHIAGKIPLSPGSSLVYGESGATFLRPVLRQFGFGPQAIQYMCGYYKKYPSTAKLLSTYIINLIVVLYNVFTDILRSDPPRSLSSDVVFKVLTSREIDLKENSLDNIDSEPKFNTHPEDVIASVIKKKLLLDSEFPGSGMSP